MGELRSNYLVLTPVFSQSSFLNFSAERFHTDVDTSLWGISHAQASIHLPRYFLREDREFADKAELQMYDF